ncbi:NAD-dependent epimerase/dehydratase family protein [Kitasatospora sp. KL5]|uniref:NAD-dependent epimerase/dehydratase family protein n=1 Tax=Kitasatospora sp. KL5 TaxID=3425125 RepID=UPI003D700AEC
MCDRSLVREDHPTGGGHRNAYGRTKAAADRLALQAGAVVLRPRAVYGPGDPHLMPRLLERVRRGLLLLPGPDVPLSLTAVQNLAEACLAAAEWAPGAYNITDAEPYRRDAAVRTVLATQGVRARIGHVPVAAAEFAARRGLLPGLTPYAVDQLARPVVLDTTRAADQGFRPRWELTSALSATNDHECATPAKIT